ncbi:multi-sensor hybrid histidine kinase [Stylonychia lemnae]|uniref:Multi-sensor hybrid histidine kinase n=1 Tax=Stylonychia lemnae TaxID=5949 RepID=A0A077ZNV6_STYLE|nr:multi-sensor hybrid histidine kinase [Stylonychia lemnae]|eukprot:CDW71598.1 multi-sensor hybrid histidine kinase [Stylonychia lemnae]
MNKENQSSISSPQKTESHNIKNKKSEVYKASSKSQNEDDMLIKMGLKQLIQKLYSSFEYDKISLKFKDKMLECKYQKRMHENVKIQGLLSFYQTIIFLLYFIGAYPWIHLYYLNQKDYVFFIIANIAQCAYELVLYLLSRKYQRVSLYYPMLIILVRQILCAEYSIYIKTDMGLVNELQLVTFGIKNLFDQDEINQDLNYCGSTEDDCKVQIIQKMKRSLVKVNKNGSKQDQRQQEIHGETNCKSFVVTTIRDMSHWIELEKQKNLTLAKTQAFASAAHEFRNPLGAIINSLDMLENSIQQEKGKNFFLTAKNCSNLMLYLVNDILDYSQLESQKLMLNIQWKRIRDILDECINILKFRADLKRIKLCYEISNDFPQKIQTDEHRLRQILINLISNAIKYTSQGHVILRCSRQFENNLSIDVEDTGVGINLQDQEKLFNPYYKDSKNRNLNKEGCGLGLIISKNLAQALQGDITLKSQLGKGSTFTLTIPKRINAIESEEPGTPQSQIIKYRVRRRKINNFEQSIQQKTIKLDYKIRHSSRQKSIFSKKDLNFQFDMPLFEVKSLDHIPRFERNFAKNYDTDLESNIYRDSNFLQKVQEYIKPMKSKLIPRLKDTHQYDSSRKQLIDDSRQIENDSIDIEMKIIDEEKCQCSQILIADDDPFNIVILEGMLNSLGIYKIDKAFNGQDAYEKVLQDIKSSRQFDGRMFSNQQSNFQQSNSCPSHENYKVIFLDNNMPILSGIEVARKIREQLRILNVSQQIKIFLISGDNINPEDLSQKNLFDQIVTKPVSLSTIKNLLSF